MKTTNTSGTRLEEGDPVTETVGAFRKGDFLEVAPEFHEPARFVLAQASRVLGTPRQIRRPALRFLPVNQPNWDDEKYELSLNGKVLKKVIKRTEATNVRNVYRAFQESGWAVRIDDPINRIRKNSRNTRKGKSGSVETRADTVKGLNSRIKSGIRFELAGEGFTWRFEERSNSPPNHP